MDGSKSQWGPIPPLMHFEGVDSPFSLLSQFTEKIMKALDRNWILRYLALLLDRKMEILIGQQEDFLGAPQGRLRIQKDDVDIIVLKHNGELFAMDSFCYHAGGPLYKGDIEDIGDFSCIVCPWHKYRVTLQTGKNLYQSIDPYNMKKPPVWTCGKIKQRTHEVIIRGNDVFVKVTPCTGELDSDHYNSAEFKAQYNLT